MGKEPQHRELLTSCTDRPQPRLEVLFEIGVTLGADPEYLIKPDKPAI